PHEDHIGGLIRALQSVPVERALDPGYAHGTTTQRNYLRLLKEKGAKTTRARAGQVHELGPAIRLEVLAPADPLLKNTEADANNNSIVARLVYGGTRFLFTGDMETAERERLLASTDPERLRSDVLKVAHHGSHNGTDDAFLRAVRPQYAVMSLARGNDYGHPHQETLDELSSFGIPTLRTDERGSITFTSDGAKIELLGPAPGRSAAPAASPRAAGAVIGNRTSKVYHAPGCGSLPARSKRVTLKNTGAAEAEGYRPHAACMVK
ncbi:MAG: ComEC/Rec2 family competence protein, partial [Actinomycetota bacterium]